MAADDWETIAKPAGAVSASSSGDGWEPITKPAAPVVAAASGSKPLAANAGLANFGASTLGLLGDTGQNAINLGLATIGKHATDLGLPAPSLMNNSVGTSEWIKQKLRATGIAGLNPDNPYPNDKLQTGIYDFTSRGGFIPGGALSAVGSMIAEKIGGPQWAGLGAMAPAAAKTAIADVASRVPKNPNAALLQDEGVSLTPGQQIGGTVKRAEDAATSIPLLGDAIKGAQRRGVEQFNTAAINRGLAPIGEELPKGLSGNKAIEYAYGKLGDAYDALLPNLKGDLSAGLQQDLDSIKTIGNNLPEPQRGQLNRIISKEVESRFTNGGLASGETLKDIESKLGVLDKGFRNSENYDVRTLGTAVQEVQNALRRMIERVNPAYQNELSKINEGYANFKIAQKAAGNVGAADGVFTPAQLHRSVKAQDISKDKARFAEGNARMQDLSIAGKDVLPSSVPDSGTALRAAWTYAMTHPVRAAGLAPFVGTAALAYTPAGQAALRGILSTSAAPTQIPLLLQQGILANRPKP